MITAELTEDRAYLDRILNHPDVRPGVVDDAVPVDQVLSAALMEEFGPTCFIRITVNGEDAGFLAFICTEEGFYQLHTCLTRVARGRTVLEVAKVGFALFFHIFRCNVLTTFALSRQVGLFAILVGFEATGEALHPNTVKGRVVTQRHYAMTRESWFARCAAEPSPDTIAQI